RRGDGARRPPRVNAAVPRGAPFLRRSLAWLLDATVLALLATALAWHWIAPAAAGFPASYQALSELVAQRLFDGLLAGTPAPALADALVHDPVLQAAAARVQDALCALLVPWTLAYAALAFPWHVAGDLSPWQASPGKRALGLRVEALDGAAPDARQAMLREAAGVLSWLTLNLGHALALVPPRRQSLHDRIAGTRVVESRG
ncbi:MAG: RDD family protein, partial [Luteimonas sp.]